MTSSSKIRVLIVDDHHLVRAGIAALLKDQKDIHVVGEAGSAIGAINKCAQLHPHVVLMDISMPEVDGIEATEELLKQNPAVKVLALTQYDQEEYVRRIMRAGARGYLLKNSLADELLKAIRAVHRGETFFTPAISNLMVHAYVKQAASQSTQKEQIHLTEREREILRLIAEGNTNQQIAKRLFISTRTVEFHRANLIQKVGAHDVASLVKYALHHKIISMGT